MEKMFINFSNHPSSQWSEAQLTAARRFGKIVDMRFPAMDPQASAEKVHQCAASIFSFIRALGKPVVMVQGEYTFTYQLVSMLQQAGIRAVAACNTRVSEEHVDENGQTLKLSYFRFEGFRDYYV